MIGGSDVGVVRVLWLAKGLGPGGAERLLVSLGGAIDLARFEVHAAYVLPWKGHLAGELEAAGVAVTCLGATGSRDLRWVGRVRRLVRRLEPDVVHSHSPLVASAARLACLGTGIELVSTEHNAASTYERPTRWLNELTWSLDAAHLAVSDDARNSFSPRRRAEVETVIHGVPLDAIRERRSERARVRADLGIGEDEVVVGTVANYRAQKDYPTLLAAARQVLDRFGVDGARFVAVGQGPLEAEVEAMHADLRLGDRFVLTGYRSDAVDVLAACDVFCLSSTYEGYPVALMEALALGLPVVATRVGGVSDAVREGEEGILVPPGQPGLLAEALLRVITDGALRRTMGERSAERADLFDIRRAAAYHEALYERLVRDR